PPAGACKNTRLSSRPSAARAGTQLSTFRSLESWVPDRRFAPSGMTGEFAKFPASRDVSARDDRKTGARCRAPGAPRLGRRPDGRTMVLYVLPEPRGFLSNR